MPVNQTICNFGWKALEFNLISVDEKTYSLKNIKGDNGTVIVFICNHCPYVKNIAERLSYESKELINIGIKTVAIMSNDVEQYPEDSFENMKEFTKLYNFDFPYLFDEQQDVAKSYGAFCTPDFFGFNKFLELQYRGRLDSGTMNTNDTKIERELFNAMELISKTSKGPLKQNASIGCTIKWK